MARRRETGLDLIAALPWPLGLALGGVAYGVIRFMLPAFLIRVGGPIGAALGMQLQRGTAGTLALIVMVLFWIGAAVSFAKRRHRRALLDRQTGLDSLARMTWREFEMLVGEAFRRRGYSLVETGLGGADGGIDLMLQKQGRVELVQCKHWKSRSVTVGTVREMWGLRDHHGAHGVKIVCVGNFTGDAKAFAVGKAIELIGGEDLLALVRSVQAAPNTPLAASAAERAAVLRIAEPVAVPRIAAPAPSPASYACPTCGGAMARRSNRKDHTSFWGCTDFPRCRGTRPV
jgi:restriction system protein